MQFKLLLFLTLMTFALGIQKVVAQGPPYTLTWTGGSNTWSNTNSWNITGVGTGVSYPGNLYTSDIVFINNSVTVTINAALPQANTIGSLTIGPGVTVNLILNAAIPHLLITNFISIGANSTLNITGPGDITGTSAISLADGAKLTTTGGATECDITAASLTATNNTHTTTILLNGNLTLSGALTVSNTGTTNLTTNGTLNAIKDRVVVSSGGSAATPNTLNWNGSGTTTVGAAPTGSCSIGAVSTLSVGAGNNITFLDGVNLSQSTPLLAKLINAGVLTFNACSLNSTGLTAAATVITNSSGGTINLTASALSTINLPTYATLSNTGTITANNGSAININNANAALLNNSGGVVTVDGASASVNLGGSSTLLTNQGTMNFTTASALNLTYTLSPGATVNNGATGTFNVGADGSAATITLRGGAGANSVTNNNIFNIGPLSVIYMTSSNASLINNSPGVFTFMSDQTGTGAVGPLTAGASCTGNFTVQRYFPGGAGYRNYRLLTLPVNISNSSNQSITTAYIDLHSLNGGMLTAGPGSNFSYATATKNPLMYLYDESRAQNFRTYLGGKNVGIYSLNVPPSYTIICYPAGATAATIPSAAVQVPVGNSVQVYYLGPNSTVFPGVASPPSTTTSSVGYLNQGQIPVQIFSTGTNTLSYSPGVNTVAQGRGLNQVGNPYPCTIDLDSLYADNKTGAKAIGPSFYELQEPNNTFVAYNGNHTSSSTGAEAYIASGQGFFVQAISPTSALTFNENEKVPLVPIGTGTSAVLLLNQKVKNSISAAEMLPDGLAGVHLQIRKDSSTYTQTGIYFNKSWNDNYSPMEDAIDMDGLSPQVYLSSYSSDGIRLCINGLGIYGNGKTVKLYASATKSGTYTINLADIKNIDNLYNIYLRDHKLNDSVNLRSTNAYTFTINKGDSTSFGANRFDLVLKREALPPYQLLSFNGQKINSGVQLNWVANNTGNYTGFVLEKKGENNVFNPIYTVQSNNNSNYNFIDSNPIVGDNIYRLAQNNINGNISYSSLITIGFNNVTSNGYFSVYPNPAKDLISILVNSTESTPSNYTADIYNTSGALMNHRILNTYTWTENISNYKEGVYIMMLKNMNGEVLAKSKFIKIK